MVVSIFVHCSAFIHRVCRALARLSHLLDILFAFVHFLVEFLLLVWSDRSLSLAIGLSGCSQLLLLAGHVVGFFGCLHLRAQAKTAFQSDEGEMAALWWSSHSNVHLLSPPSAFWPMVSGPFWNPPRPPWPLWTLQSFACDMLPSASSSPSRRHRSSGRSSPPGATHSPSRPRSSRPTRLAPRSRTAGLGTEDLTWGLKHKAIHKLLHWSSNLTLLNELPPSLGPGGQLVTVRLFYLGTFLQAAHEIVAEPMAIVKSLDNALVVPHLRTETQTAWSNLRKTSPNIHDGNGKTWLYTWPWKWSLFTIIKTLHITLL